MGWVGGWFEVVQQKTVKDYFGSDSTNQSIFFFQIYQMANTTNCTQICLIWICYYRHIECSMICQLKTALPLNWPTNNTAVLLLPFKYIG